MVGATGGRCIAEAHCLQTRKFSSLVAGPWGTGITSPFTFTWRGAQQNAEAQPFKIKIKQISGSGQEIDDKSEAVIQDGTHKGIHDRTGSSSQRAVQST